MTKTIKKSVAFLSAAVMVMAMLLYFPGGTFSNIDWGLKASAEGITLTEPSKDGSGVYQIGTANELYWFAGLVNGTLDGVTQNTAAWAKLTANITVNNNVLVYGALNTTNSGSFTSWTPIGNYVNQYTGTFDGNGKTISGLYFDNGNTKYVGLFGYVGSGGNVSNVGIVDSYFNGKQSVGGVCGENYGTIKNCYNTGAVSGNGYYAGGVCGNNYNSTIQNCYNTGAVSGQWKVGGVCGENYNSTIQNCYSTGTVSGWDKIGGVCGYNDGSTITNCYFDSDNYSGGAGHIYSGTITNVEGKTTTQFESGEVCYLLQSGQENDSESGKAPMVWGQTIGTDKAPVLTSDSKKTVYLIGVTYSNTNSEITDYEAPELNGNVYEITNASQLYWFAEYVKRGNTSAEAILKNNIVVNENVLVENGNLVGDTSNFVSWTPIGNSLKQYTGTFNGNGKTISGLYFDDSGTDYVGLFGHVGSSGNVSNVGVVASYFKGKNNVGGVCGNNNGTIKNCYNTGVVSGSNNVGGVCGNNNGTIKNCYNTGVVSGSDNVGGVSGYNGGGTIENCYFDSDNYGGDAVGYIYSGTITDVEGKTTNAFEKGEVCYLLQGGQENDSESEEAPKVWGQTIGTDKAPVLTSDSAKTVYRKTTGCATYSNTKSEITEKEHSNLGADFRCTDCGNYVAPELNKDVYEISNVSQLYWFAEYVKNGNTSAKAILKENIVVNENVLGADGKLVSDTSKFVSWTPIGSVSNKYTGTFDGNGKTISGLYFDNGGTKYVGLFGYVGSGGNVSNVGVVASYFNGSDEVSGVCGYNSGSTITNCYNTGVVSGSNNVGGVCGNNNGTIKNCYNTGAVNGSSYVGGVCGNNNGTIKNCTIKNCYNTGAVNGSSYVGGVCGWNSRATIENCYNTGAVEGIANVCGVCGFNSIGTIIKNCYYLTGTATGGINGTDDVSNNVLVKTTTQFTFGEVCYLLNNGTTDGTQVWYQTINSDSYPLLDNSHGTVYACTPCTGVFSNTSGQHADHTYIVDTENGKKHICEKCGDTQAHATSDLIYTANDATDKITVTCGECSGDLGTISLSKPTGDLTYNGNAKEAVISNDVTGVAISDPTITYKKGEDEFSSAPTDAGTYTASITIGTGEGAATVSVEFNIARRPITITADDKSKTYGGTDPALSFTVSEETPLVDDEELKGTLSREAGEDAGTYKITQGTVTNDTNPNYDITFSEGTFTINKAQTWETADCVMKLVYDENSQSYIATIEKVDNAEYSFDGSYWSNANICNEISPHNSVTGYIRIAGDKNHEPGIVTSVNETAGHGLLHVAAKAADCENDGNLEYWYCESCGQCFSDEDGETEISKEDVTIPATNHNWNQENYELDATHHWHNCQNENCPITDNSQKDGYGEHVDSDNNGICDNCNKLIHSIVREVSATLDGDIGLNYYIALPESVTADTGAYVQFTVNGQNTKFFVKDVTAEEDGTYKFTCWLTAKEMRDDVTFELYDGSGTLIDIYSNSGDKVEGASFDYSLETYLNDLSSDESDENAALKDLADATLVYGAYAQNAFNHNANSNLDGSDLADVTLGTLETNKMIKTGDIPEGLKLTEMTLILKTETALRLYFKSDNIGNYTFKLDGTGVTLNKIEEEGLYYVEIANISAKDLDTKHTLIINDNCELTFNALSYAYATVKADTNENICNVVKALYKYNDAANAYFGE